MTPLGWRSGFLRQAWFARHLDVEQTYEFACLANRSLDMQWQWLATVRDYGFRDPRLWLHFVDH